MDAFCIFAYKAEKSNLLLIKAQNVASVNKEAM